jgi:hypothetical protein
MSATFTVSTKVQTSHFQRTFRDYLAVTSRTLVDAVNNKLFMIARKASWFTHKANARHIARDLGKITYLRQKNYQKIYRHRLTKSTRPQTQGAPLAALIVNKRRGGDRAKGFGIGGAIRGKAGLYGAAMRHAIQVMIGARNASIAYIKSGWLPAIQAFAKVATIKAPFARDDQAARQIGKPKGWAETAKVGDIIKGTIANEAWATRDHKNAFKKYGGQGLQHAIDSEWADTKAQIQKELNEIAHEFNRQQK